MNAPTDETLLAAATTDTAISSTLATFAANLQFEDIPSRVVERAKLHLLDCIGIGLASSGFEFCQRTISALVGLASFREAAPEDAHEVSLSGLC